MAEVCTSCPGRPYRNICCSLPKFGISVMQPECHRLASPCNGLTLVNNPCYCPDTNKSTWTYKFFTDCTPGTNINPITYILIPVCINISRVDVAVEEKIDGFVEFTTVGFALNTYDSTFGNAPAGFQWLKIENSDRYDNGVCVEYRITITGDYPVASQPIRVRAGVNDISFQGEGGCFKVPGCPEPGRLSISKNGDFTIDDDDVTLNYIVRVKNTGGSPLKNVMFDDIITLDGVHTTIKDITIQPKPPLDYKVMSQNMIRVYGNIGTLVPGQEFVATYVITITSIDQPGTYIITNRANAISGNISGEDMDTQRIEVVRVKGEKICKVVNGNEIVFKVRVSSVCASPQTRINLVDRIQIPAGVTVEFISFDDCTASIGTGVPVSNQSVTISCNNLDIPAGGLVEKNIRLRVIELRSFQTPAQIINTLTQINYNNESIQIALPPQDVPATSIAEITGSINCGAGCN
jgi:uncharacterized repeat protein (TIGR01451 family)